MYYPDEARRTRHITRYPQFLRQIRCFRILTHLKPHGDGKGGIFRRDRLRKTYTMLFLSRLLALRERIPSTTDHCYFGIRDWILKLPSCLSCPNDICMIRMSEALRTEGCRRPRHGQRRCHMQRFRSLRSTVSSTDITSSAFRRGAQDANKHRIKLKVTDKVLRTFGFAKYLRDSFPTRPIVIYGNAD